MERLFTETSLAMVAICIQLSVLDTNALFVMILIIAKTVKPARNMLITLLKSKNQKVVHIKMGAPDKMVDAHTREKDNKVDALEWKKLLV